MQIYALVILHEKVSEYQMGIRFKYSLGAS